jgi:HTH-type transcriptional regulator/antitoxin HigA
MSDIDDPFSPNWYSPPWETIQDMLEEKNLAPDEFFPNTGLPLCEWNELINGNLIFDQYLAECLSLKLGSTPEFWLERDMQYGEDLKRLNHERWKERHLRRI